MQPLPYNLRYPAHTGQRLDDQSHPFCLDLIHIFLRTATGPTLIGSHVLVN